MPTPRHRRQIQWRIVVLGTIVLALGWVPGVPLSQVQAPPDVARIGLPDRTAAFPGLQPPVFISGVAGAGPGFAQAAFEDNVREHPKLATPLADLARAIPQRRGAMPAGERTAAPQGFSVQSLPKSVRDAVHGRMMRINQDAEVQVYILVSEITDSHLSQLQTAGATVELQHRGRRIVQARVPVTWLEEVAALPFVYFVRLPSYGVRLTGSVDTQGDSILKADQVRSMLHVDGTGVRVGVSSDGLKGVFATGCTTCQGVTGGPISTGDLPNATGTRNAAGVLISSSGGITGQSFSANNDLEGLPPPSPPCGFPGAGAEGTALLEIVHDLAPGAQLSFANSDTSLAFMNAVNFLAAHNDVVLDDIIFFGEPYDGTSDVSTNTASALNSSTNPIRAYFTAAGNQADGHYLGSYVDSGTDGSSIVGASGHLHLFQATSTTADVLGLGPTVTDKILLPAGGEIVVVLVWNDPFGSSSNNYDLFLVQESTGSVVASSTNPQTGSQDPVESIDYVNETGAQNYFHIIIQNVANRAAARNLNMFLFEPECAQSGPLDVAPPNHAKHNYNTIASSVAAQGDAGGTPVSVTSLGAVRASDPSTIEFFSSNGPTIDGRVKPDVTGVDGVSVTGAGSFENPFFGTSAAAPHAGGVAALLLQAASCLLDGASGAVNNVTARMTLRNLILNNATSLGGAAPNNVFGYGLINALAAAEKTIPIAGSVPNQTVSGNTPTGASVSLPTTGFSDPDQCPLTVSATGGCSSSGSTVNCPFGANTVTLMATNNGVTFSSPITVRITVTNFSVSVSPSSATVSAGQSATYTVTATPQMGPFTSAISLGCSNLPAQSKCAFSPASLNPGANPATSTLTVSTTAASWLLPLLGPRVVRPVYLLTRALITLALAAVVLAAGKPRRLRLGLYALSGLLVAFLALQAACGGGGSGSGPPPLSGGTPSGTYNITITGTAGSLVPTGTATLTVK